VQSTKNKSASKTTKITNLKPSKTLVKSKSQSVQKRLTLNKTTSAKKGAQKTTKVKLHKAVTKVVTAKKYSKPNLEKRIRQPASANPLVSSGRFLTNVFEPGRVSFHLLAKDMPFAYRVTSLYVKPQEVIDFSIVDANNGQSFKVQAKAGKLARLAEKDYRWTAPNQSGTYRLDITKGSERMQVNLFVLKPMPKNGVINQYSIGRYPEAAKDGDPRYLPPTGLIEVTEANKDMLISPHFRLGQFVCKQEGGYPKYLYLQERLLMKLEWLLAEVNRRGYFSPSFSVMSGYRTPFYNNRLNNVSLSRHQWGDAADIFIDNDQDGVLDDLNKDGRIDKADAQLLYELFEQLEEPNPTMHGGLGLYEANAFHGPFVHVDARGTQARWGMND
jgi:hypothetical protein